MCLFLRVGSILRKSLEYRDCRTETDTETTKNPKLFETRDRDRDRESREILVGMGMRCPDTSRDSNGQEKNPKNAFN